MDQYGKVDTGTVAIVALVTAGLALFGLVAYLEYGRPAAVVNVSTFDTVSIGISDVVTGDGIENVKVKLTNAVPHSDTTDEDGKAAFLNIPAGNYTMLAKGASVDNYYWLSRSVSITGVKEDSTDTFGTSYQLTRYGNGDIDNTVDTANRAIDNTFDEGVVSFGGIFKNIREDAELTSAVVTVTLEYTGVVFENIEVSAGATITEVTEGTKYEVALASIPSESSVFVTLKIGISGVNTSGERVDILAKLDDTPAVDDDVGAAEVSAEFDIVVS